MYLGASPFQDFAICAGLGVASASCALAAAIAARESTAFHLAAPLAALLRGFIFLLFGGALLSIAALLGDTKAIRDPNSILGFAVGALLASPLAFAALRRRR